MKRVLVIAMLIAACSDEPKLRPEELQDPNTCLSCHPKHFEQWSGSMHAYASIDPIFRAAHKRGQRETNGEMGLFCVNCHAPMAVANGTITEANVRDFDFDTLSPAETGITCYFCHNVVDVTTDHNNGLVLAMDQTMRGGAANPVDNPAHHSAFSPLMAGATSESLACGSCHDVVNPAGVRIENTFAEWKQTIFASTPEPTLSLTCSECHMTVSDDVIADAPGLDVPFRPNGMHDHMMPGIDQAMVPFPQIAEQEQAIYEFLEPAIGIKGLRPRTERRAYGGICLDPPGELRVRVDSFNVGHSFPSGAAFDRRVWLEVTGYDANNNVVFQRGAVPDGMDPEQLGESDLFGLWARAKNGAGLGAHFFWEIASIDPDPLHVLPGPVTFDELDPRFDHSRTAYYDVPNYTSIERIEAKLRMRALSYELIRLLEESGDLAPGFADKLPTLEVQQSTWLKSTKGTGLALNTNCNPS